MNDRPDQHQTTLGKPLSLPRPTPIAVLHEGDAGYWKLSDECRRDLEEIERAIIRR